MASLRIATAEEEEVQQGTRQLIRRFSHDVAENKPNDSLAVGLKQATVHEEKSLHRPWRRWYEDEDGISVYMNPDNDDLQNQAKMLEHQWKSFSEFLETANEEENGKRKKRFWKKDSSVATSAKWEIEGQSGRKPDIDDIVAAVRGVEQKWKEQDRLFGGKPQKLFRSFCNSLQGHSNMLQMLPSQNQYLSIFCGALTTLLEASANHQRTSEGLAKALDEISSEIDFCVENVKLMYVEDMRQAIGILYSHIFHFFKSAMEWYQSRSLKKVLNAFNESFYDRFEEQIVKIKSLSDWIQKKGNLKSRAELRDVRLKLDYIYEQNLELRASLQEEKHKRDDWQKIGQHMLEMLRSSTEAWRFKPEIRPADIKSQEMASPKYSLAIEDRAISHRGKRVKSPRPATLKKSTLQMWSRGLEEHMSITLDTLQDLNPDVIRAGPSVIEAIQDWSQATSSQSLWIQGPFEDAYPSLMSEVVGKVVSIALDFQLPILCFFCDLQRYEIVENTNNANPAALALIDLVYSLIRQLIDTFPAQVHALKEVTKYDFRGLTGSLGSYGDAVVLLNRLLYLVPSTMLVFIDGLEQFDDLAVSDDELEYDSSESHYLILNLLEVLQDHMEQKTSRFAKDKGLMKILYTSAGPCATLEALDKESLQWVEVEEGTLHAEMDLDFCDV